MVNYMKPYGNFDKMPAVKMPAPGRNIGRLKYEEKNNHYYGASENCPPFSVVLVRKMSGFFKSLFSV